MKLNFNTLMACIALLLITACSSQAQNTDVAPEAFEKVINTQQVQLLDVRTAAEYGNGHLKNALQADWNNEAEFQKRIQSLDKRVPIYTYCLSGARSGAAAKWLNENGYKAYNMQGGINSWRNAGKSLEQQAIVKQVSMAEYLEQVSSAKTVLVDFGAEWCPPCKKMAPVLEDIEKTSGKDFLLVKIDGGAQASLVKELGITEFPTFIIYRGGTQTWRKTGLVEKAEIIAAL